jgi:DNA polymerase-3 subunit epsilon
MVALDLETTGLDPQHDSILSIGLVNIDRMQIDLSTALHQMVRTDSAIPEESAVIHGITDDQSARGSRLEDLVVDLLPRLAGRVLLAHYANIERQFLDAACRKIYGTPFLAPFIDTLELGRRLLERRNEVIRSGDLRLFNLRRSFNLPRYAAHNALNDAIATAELFLAIVAEMDPSADCRLRYVVTG